MISLQLGGKSDLSDLAFQVNQIMDQFMQKSFFRFRPCGRWQPAINLYETETMFVVCIDMAGIDPKQVEIHAKNNILYIAGERATPVPAEASCAKILVMEIDHGPFYREVSLPEDVDVSKVEARYHLGFLWVELPKNKTK
ncbi:MAG: Hsp20/alpha crystallin family protein [Phycisphaerae bacterium]